MSKEVIILLVVVILAITGLALTSAQQQGAVISSPMPGDECLRVQCPDGLSPAKLKQDDAHVFCACGSYTRGESPDFEFEYDLSNAHWSSISP